jgi:hypothetical protein
MVFPFCAKITTLFAYIPILSRAKDLIVLRTGSAKGKNLVQAELPE